MRIVSTLCISKEKLSLLKFSRKIQKLPRVERGGGGGGGGGSMPIKDVQEWGVLRPKLDVYG